MLVGFEAVPDLSVEPEVGERVDVGAGMGVHRHRRARVAHVLVLRGPHVHRIGDEVSARRVGEPELVLGIARGLPARHADEVLDGEVVDRVALDPREDRGARLRRHQVEATDLVGLSPRALSDGGVRRAAGGGGDGERDDAGGEGGGEDVMGSISFGHEVLLPTSTMAPSATVM